MAKIMETQIAKTCSVTNLFHRRLRKPAVSKNILPLTSWGKDLSREFLGGE